MKIYKNKTKQDLILNKTEHNINCETCGANIIGKRYLCLTCINYNIC